MIFRNNKSGEEYVLIGVMNQNNEDVFFRLKNTKNSRLEVYNLVRIIKSFTVER